MEELLVAKNLKKYYKVSDRGEKRIIRALDDVSLTIYKGRNLALIGESGSGKSTFGKAVSMIDPPDSGEICFMGKHINCVREKNIRPLRKHMQMIFQCSNGVFDPTYTIGESIEEVIKNYQKVSDAECTQMVSEVLELTGLSAQIAGRYAHQLSGGQCQRANIARSLVLRPELVICDEPVSSLDYSIRKQILDLLNDMKERLNLTYLFITHDLSNVPYVCDSLAIMYRGRVVEYLDSTDNIEKDIKHPYTQELFRSIPSTNPRKRKIIKMNKRITFAGKQKCSCGCSFADRCPMAEEKCMESVPQFRQLTKGHYAACHLIN